MSLPKASLLVLGILVLAATASGHAFAQPANTDKTFDFKPFVPPILPLPRNSVLTPGSVGAVTPSPYTAPLYDSNPTALPAPGIRLTIPTR